MDVRPFLDTNVVAYSLANDAHKKTIATDLLLDCPLISVQVVNELVSVATRKLGYARESAIAAARFVMTQCEVLPMDQQDVQQAFRITERYGFNHWDALILSVAERHGAMLVLSEDMQDGQIIGAGLRIRNPFVSQT